MRTNPEVQEAMDELGMDELQAVRHIQGRRFLRRLTRKGPTSSPGT